MSGKKAKKVRKELRKAQRRELEIVLEGKQYVNSQKFLTRVNIALAIIAGKW